jgi:hypothetical protein
VLVDAEGNELGPEQAEEWSPMPASVNVVRVLKPEEYGSSTAEQLAA